MITFFCLLAVGETQAVYAYSFSTTTLFVYFTPVGQLQIANCVSANPGIHSVMYLYGLIAKFGMLNFIVPIFGRTVTKTTNC